MILILIRGILYFEKETTEENYLIFRPWTVSDMRVGLSATTTTIASIFTFYMFSNNDLFIHR